MMRHDLVKITQKMNNQRYTYHNPNKVYNLLIPLFFNILMKNEIKI